MFDPNFFRTVVLMIQHNEHGALGLVLNRPLKTTVKEAWEQVSEMPCEIDSPLHSGGPCEGPLMVLHARPMDGETEVQIVEGVHFTTDRDAIEQLVLDFDGESPLRFFVGYAGWSPGQLENELGDGGWMVAPGTQEVVFGEVEDLWVSAFKSITQRKDLPGVNPKCIPEDPSLN